MKMQPKKRAGIVELASEAIQSATLPFQRINNVQGRDGFALGMLGVCHGVADNTFEEGFQHYTGLLVDH